MENEIPNGRKESQYLEFKMFGLNLLKICTKYTQVWKVEKDKKSTNKGTKVCRA
jgi:hypothetical protein